MNQETAFQKLFALGNSYWLTRFVILRLLGFVYAVAFLVAAQQLVPLIGEHGLTPATHFLASVQTQLGSKLRACCECRRSSGLEFPIPHCRSSRGSVSLCRLLCLLATQTRLCSAFSGRCTCRSFTSARSGTVTAGKFSCSRPASCRSFFVRYSMGGLFQNAGHRFW